jgi:hypothetical protein
MDAKRLLAAIVVGCAATACALDVAPDPGDSTAPPTVAPINTGAARDPHPGSNCMPLVAYDADAGVVTLVGGYACPEPSTRMPDPASGLPTKLPGKLLEYRTSPR